MLVDVGQFGTGRLDFFTPTHKRVDGCWIKTSSAALRDHAEAIFRRERRLVGAAITQRVKHVGNRSDASFQGDVLAD